MDGGGAQGWAEAEAQPRWHAWTEPQREKPENIITPKTLHKLVKKENAIPLKKKGRKRKNKKETASQPQPVMKPIRS
jgi:hypothetical protein